MNTSSKFAFAERLHWQLIESLYSPCLFEYIRPLVLDRVVKRLEHEVVADKCKAVETIYLSKNKQSV